MESQTKKMNKELEKEFSEVNVTIIDADHNTNGGNDQEEDTEDYAD